MPHLEQVLAVVQVASIQIWLQAAVVGGVVAEGVVVGGIVAEGVVGASVGFVVGCSVDGLVEFCVLS